MVTSSFCLCLALVYINVYDAGFFVRGGRQQVEGRGVHVEIKQKGQNVIFDLFPCTISYRYISSHVVSYEPPHDHQTYVHHHHCSSPSPCGYGCPFHPPLSAHPTPALAVVPWPVILAGGAEKQRSASGTRPLCVRDDEEGHLICRSGDVLQERCTHCHYYYYSSTLIS